MSPRENDEDSAALDSPSRLPRTATVEAFDALVDDEQLLRPGVEALCQTLGLDISLLRRFESGSLPVYAVGQVVLKLFPPPYVHEQPVEAGVLSALEGHLPVPTPAVLATGEHDGWTYVLMDHLPGVELSGPWPSLGRAERVDVAGQAGALAAAVHLVQPPRIKGPWPEDWESFVAHQRATAVERHRRWGLSAPWLDQVPAFLASVDLEPGGPTGSEDLVLLHTEIMPANLLGQRGHDGRWNLSGLIDLEPAMHGRREYELVAVAIFLAEGDPAVLGAALTGYGYAPHQLDQAFRRQMMAWTLLHRYGNLASYLQRLPAPPQPTLEALADRWFAVEATR